MKVLLVSLFLSLCNVGDSCNIGDPCIVGELWSNMEELMDRGGRVTQYDPSYVKIAYPNGDVPANKGVCTDVIIRAYRKVGIDLQKDVHEDMKANFDKYPKKYGMKAPDTNIDHRRVGNLMTFFSRHGVVLPITNNPKDYKPGDIVCWDLGGGILHIGFVLYTYIVECDEDNPPSGNCITDNVILHNIGYGQVLNNCLFNWKIIGHYRYYGIKKGEKKS